MLSKASRLFILLFFLILLAICCANGQDKPEPVLSVIYVEKPASWYETQEELWKKEIEKDPGNAAAWRNYYNAVRYNRFAETIHTPEKRERLQKIMEEMAKAVPESYEYNYLKHKTEGSITDISFLEKAYQLRPQEPELYSDFSGYYEVAGDESKMSEFLEKWYGSKDLAPGLLNYNYNVLFSLEENAILFTNGDNDTYPVWMLQKVKKIRPDVTVLNVSLIMTGKEYLERKLKEKSISLSFDELPKYRSKEFAGALGKFIAEKYPEVPVYFAVTVYQDYLAAIEENLYLVGLAYKYSSSRFDNIALIKKNLEKRFRLDYLKNDWYSEDYLANPMITKINLNYIAPSLALAEHYAASDLKESAKYWVDIALHIGEQGGIRKKVEESLNEEGLNELNN
jgi:hypothetical protein